MFINVSNFSCSDHFIAYKNMFDCIINKCVVHDICNPSYHNLLLLTLSINCFIILLMREIHAHAIPNGL